MSDFRDDPLNDGIEDFNNYDFDQHIDVMDTDEERLRPVADFNNGAVQQQGGQAQGFTPINPPSQDDAAAAETVEHTEQQPREQGNDAITKWIDEKDWPDIDDDDVTEPPSEFGGDKNDYVEHRKAVKINNEKITLRELWLKADKDGKKRIEFDDFIVKQRAKYSTGEPPSPISSCSNLSDDEDEDDGEEEEPKPTPAKGKASAPKAPRGIPTQETALRRLEKDFADSTDRELYRETRLWIEKFYKARAKVTTRTSLSSDANFRREITTPIHNVYSAFVKNNVYSHLLPSRAALIGSVYLHPEGHVNSTVTGVLLKIQRLDLISIPEIKYTNLPHTQHRQIVQLNDRILDMEAAADRGRQIIQDNKALVKNNNNLIGHAAAKVSELEPKVSQLEENFAIRDEQMIAAGDRIVALEANSHRHEVDVDALYERKTAEEVVAEFKANEHQQLVDEVRALREQVRELTEAQTGKRAAPADAASPLAKRPKTANPFTPRRG